MRDKRVGILGAGTMGKGIARAFAQKGYRVMLCDPHETARQKAFHELSATLPEGSFSIHSALPEVKDEIIIEAVPEDFAIKQAVLQEIAPHISAQTIVATNTSALSVTGLAKDLPYRERFLGWHFFNPAYRLPLVEVIPTPFTMAAVVEESQEILRSIEKVPIIAPDLPGFIVNRVARPYYVEALRLVEEGNVSPEVVDRLMEGLGFRMGPFRLMDFIGIDVNHAVTEAVWRGLWMPPRFRPSWLQAQKVAAGHTGKKAGQGFYSYQ
ncbi:MAG: 3-hydroxyacyl-CoA dehydrogenase family protein [Bacteroidia bacterium]|nr:3-hydroxyacyl-CoA dehydrogenase family protein [Bacteroidia bacterium]MDW8235576.1 3-hydroxyacyl-CoA dehydrogenase family protein [Bacteroidia bacterium]